MSSSTWLPESATECTPSASIEAATNLLTAIPRFAPSAVTTARVLPSAATNQPLPRLPASHHFGTNESGMTVSALVQVGAVAVAWFVRSSLLSESGEPGVVRQSRPVVVDVRVVHSDVVGKGGLTGLVGPARTGPVR